MIHMDIIKIHPNGNRMVDLLRRNEIVVQRSQALFILQSVPQ